MKESKVEKELAKHVHDRGGLCLKFVSPGWAGAPDRVVHPGDGRTIYVETKRPGGRLRPLQAKRHEQLQGAGMDVRTVDSIDGVIDFILEVFGG